MATLLGRKLLICLFVGFSLTLFVYVFCFVFHLISCIGCNACYFGFFGLLVMNPIPGFGETFEIGWMIIQVDLIGDIPYRVDLRLYPLG